MPHRKPIREFLSSAAFVIVCALVGYILAEIIHEHWGHKLHAWLPLGGAVLGLGASLFYRPK